MRASRANGANGAAEFCIRFPCRGCGKLLFLPVTQKEECRADKCPHCQTPVAVPELDSSVHGYERIVPNGNKRRAQCPKCGEQVPLDGFVSGAAKRCPSCNANLKLPSAPHASEQSPGSHANGNGKPAGENADPKPRPRASKEKRNGNQPDRAAPPKKSAAKRPPPAPPPCPEEQIEETRSVRQNGFPQKVVPLPIYYQGQRAAMSSGFPSIQFGAYPRSTWWTVYILFRWVAPLLMLQLAAGMIHAQAVEEGALLSLGSIGWLFLGGRASDFLTNGITSLLVSSFRCPGCGEGKEAVGRWQCGCGFVDYREQHAWRFHCPKCHAWLGYVNCDQCDSTLILR